MAVRSAGLVLPRVSCWLMFTTAGAWACAVTQSTPPIRFDEATKAQFDVFTFTSVARGATPKVRPAIRLAIAVPCGSHGTPPLAGDVS
jgi:hypothetical protein